MFGSFSAGMNVQTYIPSAQGDHKLDLGPMNRQGKCPLIFLLFTIAVG